MSAFVSLLPASFRTCFLEYLLARSTDPANTETVTVRFVDGLAQPLAFRAERSGNRTTILLDRAGTRSRSAYRMTCKRLPAMVYLISRLRPNVREVAGNLGDGNWQEPDWLCFCSNRKDVIMVVDPIFFNSSGYSNFRRIVGTPWESRAETVLWRGSMTGLGKAVTPTMDSNDERLRPRVRLCLKLAGVPGTDVKLRKLIDVDGSENVATLEKAGVLGGKVRQSNWRKVKFAIDIGGYTNAWSNFFIRLLLGCCVIKVESEGGFRQWFYDRLVPWTHYVPVRADMADLQEKIDWCRSNDRQCRQIAAAGNALARAMTFESETRASIESIDRRLG